jgi:hypothetical protein
VNYQVLNLFLGANFGWRSISSYKLLNELFKNPVTKVEQAALTCKLNLKAANDPVGLFALN